MSLTDTRLSSFYHCFFVIVVYTMHYMKMFIHNKIRESPTTPVNAFSRLLPDVRAMSSGMRVPPPLPPPHFLHTAGDAAAVAKTNTAAITTAVTVNCANGKTDSWTPVDSLNDAINVPNSRLPQNLQQKSYTLGIGTTTMLTESDNRSMSKRR